MQKPANKNNFGNAWKRLQAENTALKQQLLDKQNEVYIRQFADAMLHDMGVLLALQPYATWPELAKTCFQHQRRQAPTAAELYKQRLPE